MQKTSVMLGPHDQGRAMTLAEFDQATGTGGLLFELSQGVVTVIDVPGRRHLAQVNALRRQVHAYDAAHPGVIHTIASGGECKISVAELESERHPDLAIYKTAPPADTDFWAAWVPEIVIEIVSPGSEQRDYVEKREEYLRFGVREYWILDAPRHEMLVLRRAAGRWSEHVIRPTDRYATSVLPDFELDCREVFAAADAAAD